MIRARHHSHGFTLIELMIVVAVIAIVASIAIPNLVSARIRANETATVSNLKAIWTGQAQFQAGGSIDLDNDGMGEYGFLRELSGGGGIRLSGDGSAVGAKVAPPRIGVGFQNIDGNGAAPRTGYRYMILLPDGVGAGVHEAAAGAFSGTVDNELAELTFCIYAWPNTYAATGSRTFFINVSGDIIAADWTAYSGDNFHVATVEGAAFTFGAGPGDSITGVPAVGTYGRDLNWWTPIN